MEQYQILKVLGSGSYGRALQVSKKSTREIYCIKQIDLKNQNLTLEV
jgi:hypothetical protein